MSLANVIELLFFVAVFIRKRPVVTVSTFL
jgi:hypothetical protein